MEKKKNSKYFRELKVFEEQYYDIISNFSVNFPKIINLNEEKLKFFKELDKNKLYNPQFIFEKKEFNIEKFEKLKNLKINVKDDVYGFKKLYSQRLKTKTLELECHLNWGTEISTKFVKLYRGQPSRLLLFLAKRYCKNFKREIVKFKSLTPQEASIRLKAEVKNLTNKDIDVEILDLNSKVNISPISNLIKLNKNEKFTSLDIKRLKVHEIGVHYLRYFNATNTKIKILERGTSNYIETEEGLAVFCEELKGVSSNAQMYIYAGRVIATYYSLRKSFYEVFKILKKYNFKDEDAFNLVLRAKRNLKDTSKKGGFTKDYVYFKGYKKIKKFAKKNDIKQLFIGKIKIEDLKLLKNFIKEFNPKIKTIFD